MITDELRAANAELWQAAIEHPFVAGIAAGTVDPARFRRYLVQDQLYLTAYARCLGHGVAKSRDLGELRIFGTLLNSLVSGESLSNDTLLARLAEVCGPLGEPAAALPANRAYIDFLLGIAASGDTLEILTALLPCAWSYGDIGAAYPAAGPADSLYADWFGYLASAEYTELLAVHRAAIDTRAGAADLDRLSPIFHVACRMELDFWDMAAG
jgi:thiaminase (transcriptional activator TenA)